MATKGRPRVYEDTYKYAAQKRWEQKHAKKYGVTINKRTDEELVDFLDNASEYVTSGMLFRYGISLAKMFTDNFDVVAKYEADNGDEFIRIRTYFNGRVEKKKDTIKCKAVYIESPVRHLSYCMPDGRYIAAAGTQVHERLDVSTEFLYTKRVSKKTKGENAR